MTQFCRNGTEDECMYDLSYEANLALYSKQSLSPPQGSLSLIGSGELLCLFPSMLTLTMEWNVRFTTQFLKKKTQKENSR